MSPSLSCACRRSYVARRVVAHSRLGRGWACSLVWRLGIADRAYRHRGGNFTARACIRHCLCPSRTERTDARQHNRLKLLQLACGCWSKWCDITIQGRFAACLYSRPACYGASDTFHRDFWIQSQEPTLIRHHHPSLRNHLACHIPCLSDSSYPTRNVISCIADCRHMLDGGKQMWYKSWCLMEKFCPARGITTDGLKGN